MKGGPALAVHNLVKRFGEVAAVDRVSFTAPAGAFLSLLGPSGSGKTTILRLLGGFESPDEGTIEIGGVDVGAQPPYKRDIGVVFQRYALFPHMTVAQNVGFSLKQRGVASGERKSRVAQMLATVGLPDLGERYPSQLSGGQQQRVALARALVFNPRVLLMDEPLAALDKRLRENLQQEIRSLQRRLGITTIYVTHDQTEAFAMSDLVAVMNGGKIEQLDVPRALYEAPQSEFVAQFLGDSNLLRGEAMDPDTVRLADGTLIRHSGVRSARGNATLLVRPEKIGITASAASAGALNTLAGRVADVVFLGEVFDYRVATAGLDVIVREQNRAGFAPARMGDAVTLSWAASDTIAL